MNSRHYAELEQAIQNWLDENCQTTDWADVIVGDKTVELMAHAARVVFDACADSQQFAIREGYLRQRYAEAQAVPK